MQHGSQKGRHFVRQNVMLYVEIMLGVILASVVAPLKRHFEKCDSDNFRFFVEIYGFVEKKLIFLHFWGKLFLYI
jgi:hypothetical protein